MADFQIFFTVTISRKFAMQQSLNIPPYPPTRRYTIPCEIFMSENRKHLWFTLCFTVAHPVYREIDLFV